MGCSQGIQPPADPKAGIKKLDKLSPWSSESTREDADDAENAGSMIVSSWALTGRGSHDAYVKHLDTFRNKVENTPDSFTKEVRIRRARDPKFQEPLGYGFGI
mmetsp:Transcript_64164/g.150422  ORF Transcript_64164/g.150422 Transcript_64164/m.150422 type:complete len:103 (-) Transcript_64164:54-362(-)